MQLNKFIHATPSTINNILWQRNKPCSFNHIFPFVLGIITRRYAGQSKIERNKKKVG